MSNPTFSIVPVCVSISVTGPLRFTSCTMYNTRSQAVGVHSNHRTIACLIHTSKARGVKRVYVQAERIGLMSRARGNSVVVIALASVVPRAPLGNEGPRARDETSTLGWC